MSKAPDHASNWLQVAAHVDTVDTLVALTSVNKKTRDLLYTPTIRHRLRTAFCRRHTHVYRGIEESGVYAHAVVSVSMNHDFFMANSLHPGIIAGQGLHYCALYCYCSSNLHGRYSISVFADNDGFPDKMKICYYESRDHDVTPRFDVESTVCISPMSQHLQSPPIWDKIDFLGSVADRSLLSQKAMEIAEEFTALVWIYNPTSTDTRRGYDSVVPDENLFQSLRLTCKTCGHVEPDGRKCWAHAVYVNGRCKKIAHEGETIPAPLASDWP